MPRPERSADKDDADLAEFAQGLRTLRASAELRLADLAERAHYSIAALSEASSGRRGKLPSWELTRAYVEACGGDPADWEVRWSTASGRPVPAGRESVYDVRSRNAPTSDGSRIVVPVRPSSLRKDAKLKAWVGVVIGAVLALLGATLPTLFMSGAPAEVRPAGSTTSTVPVIPTYTETVDNVNGAAVFRNPSGADITVPGSTRIPYRTQVQVQCWALNESDLLSVNAFYLIQTKPWTGTWAPANTFANGDPVGKAGTTAIDPQIPRCRGYANVASTWTETTGTPAHTWANPTQLTGAGTPLGPRQSVQVLCRVKGYVVEDGDPWWYLLASKPWNGHYYATSDAFYNNGATSGSVDDGVTVDERVPVCRSGG